MAKIKFVSDNKTPELTEVRRLPRGKVIDFPSAKIPRIIGRKSSMLNMLKEESNGDIIIGINGYIWMSEKCDIPKLMEAIEYIQKNAHKSGLTDAVSALLRKKDRT